MPKIETPEEGAEAGAFQIVNEWEIIQDEKGDKKFAGRKVQFDRVIVGGKNPKTGEDYSLNRELMYIGAIQIPWTCMLCGNPQQEGPRRDDLDYKCPGCNEILTQVEFLTEDCTGKVAMIEVNKSPRMQKGATGQYDKAALDEDNKPIYDNRVSRYKSVQA